MRQELPNTSKIAEFIHTLFCHRSQLPRAPEALAAQEAAERERAEAAARAAYEADVAAVRQLRMTLRDVATKLLCDRRWRALAAPVSPEDDPTYWQRVGYLPSDNMQLYTFCSYHPNRMHCAYSLLRYVWSMIPPSGTGWGALPSDNMELYDDLQPMPAHQDVSGCARLC